jgi:hypothetical protein
MVDAMKQRRTWGTPHLLLAEEDLAWAGIARTGRRVVQVVDGRELVMKSYMQFCEIFT